MKAVDIIKETREYYENNARAFDDKHLACRYKTSTGDMCAVGRCLVDPIKLEEALYTLYGEVAEADWYTIYSDFNNGKIEAEAIQFKSEYQGLPLKFWANLQSLHDTSTYWRSRAGKNTLTKAGCLFYEVLIKEWELYDKS